jgi:hypothetical protein
MERAYEYVAASSIKAMLPALISTPVELFPPAFI